MAEIAVEVAITIIDKVVTYIILANQRKANLNFDSTRKWLKTMRAYLKDTEGIREVTEGLKDRVQQVRDVAYDIEDVVEEFMLEVPEHFHEHKITKLLHNAAHLFIDQIPLHRLYSNMEVIKGKIKAIEDLDRFRVLVPEQASSSGGGEVPQVCYPKVMDDGLVGIEKLKDELLEIIENEESSGQMVISVVGSRGSGKTTLIKEVYETLKDDFDCHAWIPVPHPVTAGMSYEICIVMELPVPQGTVAKHKLRSYLQGKRYLVVFDGIWNKDEWNYIQSELPNGCPGSKIIISTHKHDVGSYCAHPCNTIYHLNGLTWEDGWELFCNKTFRDKRCPKHLVDSSQRILIRCEGLPLAIVTVASLLSNKPQTTSEFEKLHNSLGHELGNSDHLLVMGKILQQSYYHLSHNVKCCFLYFCNFPEDYSVTRGRLVRLWIAEQFVEERGNKTMEDLANEYLNELIQMNLVYESRRDLQGRVRSCRVHNIVREFILSKSEDENFCMVFTRTNRCSGEQPRRLSLHNFPNRSLRSTNLTRVRTLMTFGRDSCTGLIVEKPLDSFRFLRVLDLEDAALKSFPEQVVNLILLRYLSLRNININAVPRSVEKLQKLLSLDLRQTCVKKLPKKILKLDKLVYLLVSWKVIETNLYISIT